MIAKRILFFISILFISHLSIKPEDNKPDPTIGTIISDVAMMTDDIAEMIIVCKAEKDPKKIKALIASLVKSIANIIETIVEKRRLKKLNRSISIEEFDFSDISSKSLEQEIEEIICAIIHKARVNNEY